MQRDMKVVVITGAGSGIGAALAKDASLSGWRPILAGRRHKALLKVAAQLPKNSNALCVSADVTQVAGRDAIRDACQAAGGRINMLINNAGVVSAGSFEEMDGQAVAAMINTNLAGPIALTRVLLPFLRQSVDARILNIGSMFGDISFPLFSVYSTTKFGLRGFSDGLRRELGPEKIEVTYAAPRAVKTPAADGFNELVEPFQMKLDCPEDVAQKIWRGALKGKKQVYPWGPERIFLFIQSVMPSLIDRSLIKQYQAYLSGNR